MKTRALVIMSAFQIDLTAPFGGYKRSGNGREWGDHGFEAFFEVKAFIGLNPAIS